MSTPVGCRIRSSLTDESALSETPFTVSRHESRVSSQRSSVCSETVPECSCCSLLRMSCRVQKDPCMTLPYPFTVRETHRRSAGPAGDESVEGGTLETPPISTLIGPPHAA